MSDKPREPKGREWREFWIDPATPKAEVTPWPNPVSYLRYHCLDLPGGYWPSRALHVIEYAALEAHQSKLAQRDEVIRIFQNIFFHNPAFEKKLGHSISHGCMCDLCKAQALLKEGKE